MAFGFIGDIVENIGEVILPRGTRGSTIGGAIGAGLTGGSATGAAFGSAIGSGFTQNLSSSIATGSQGQEAVSSPTASQSPSFAPESAMSSDGFPGVYRPTYTAGFSPRLPGTVRDTTMGIGLGEAAEMIADINISKFFGNGTCAQKMKRLVSVDRDGCTYVTRKQQGVLRKMLMYLPIEEVAYSAGVSTDDIARMVSKSFAPRRKGISAADVRTANRVNNQTLRNARKLGYDLSPKSKTNFNKGC